MANVHTRMLGVINRVRHALMNGDERLAVVLLEAGVEEIERIIGPVGPPADTEPTDDQP